MTIAAAALAIILVGCSAADAQQPAASTAPTPSPAPKASATATPSSTPSPSPAAVAAPTRSPEHGTVACYISLPVEMLGDKTPVVFSVTGVSETGCATVLERNAAEDAQRVKRVPSGKPVCTQTKDGYSVKVWGTAAAKLVCGSLR